MCHTTTTPRANFFHSVWCCMALVCIDTIEVIMGDTSAIAYSASALKRIGQIMMERGQLDNGEGVTLLGTDLLKSPNLFFKVRKVVKKKTVFLRSGWP